MIKKNKVK